MFLFIHDKEKDDFYFYEENSGIGDEKKYISNLFRDPTKVQHLHDVLIGKTIHCYDKKQNPDICYEVETVMKNIQKLDTLICAPILKDDFLGTIHNNDPQCIGVLCLANKSEGKAFNTEDENLISDFDRQASQ